MIRLDMKISTRYTDEEAANLWIEGLLWMEEQCTSGEEVRDLWIREYVEMNTARTPPRWAQHPDILSFMRVKGAPTP